MSDVNQRALKLAKMNAKLHSAEVKIFQSDLYKNIKTKYDSIYGLRGHIPRHDRGTTVAAYARE